MKLDRRRAVAEAIKLLNEVGLEGLTMRALATKMSAQAASLYYHFPSKQALLDDMADSIVSEIILTDLTNEGVEIVIPSVARRFRSALLQYRDGARVYAGTYALRPNVFGLFEACMASLLRSGYEATGASHAIFNLFYYILGLVIEEQALLETGAASDPQSVRARFAELAGEQFPAIAANLDAVLSADFDVRFELGLAAHMQALASKSAVA